jgi:GH43 family beta-xylosidase
MTEWVPPMIQKHADHTVYVHDVWSEYDAVSFIKNKAAELLQKEAKHGPARRRS